MVREVQHNLFLDLLRKFHGKVKAWTALSPSAYDAKIVDVYRRVIDREPNEDELMHWNVSLAGGTSIRQVENSLKASYEYDQLNSRKDTVLVHLPTFKLYCRSSDLDVGRQIIQSQSFEPHVASVLKDVLKPGSVFVDLGANIGYFSLMAATFVGPTGKVISFEPNARNLGLFYASIVENGMKNIVVFPVAASYSSQIHRLQSFGSTDFWRLRRQVRRGCNTSSLWSSTKSFSVCLE